MSHASTVADPGLSDAPSAPRVSALCGSLVGSEILRIAAQIRQRVEQGARVCNLTVGDFAPSEFRIPPGLTRRIEAALVKGETNYPPSNGLPALREAALDSMPSYRAAGWGLDSVLVTSGSRPGIYGTYTTLVDPGDRVVYGVPSWNNNHYSYLAGAEGVAVQCRPEHAFLPTREDLEPVIGGARLLALNSPSNPLGTSFSRAQLAEICDLVLEENARRGDGERPLYLMYDQVYALLAWGPDGHVDPLSIRPELAPYTVYVDGISKGFAATGLRVGWVVGPADVIRPMSDLLGHVGTWAPRPEQVATAELLRATAEVSEYRDHIVGGVRARIDRLRDGLAALHAKGHEIDFVEPTGAIYLGARFAPHGRRTADGRTLRTNEDVRAWLLDAAGMAVVPFQAFGAREETGWFRLSVGATSIEEIDALMPRLGAAFAALGSRE